MRPESEPKPNWWYPPAKTEPPEAPPLPTTHTAESEAGLLRLKLAEVRSLVSMRVDGFWPGSDRDFCKRLLAILDSETPYRYQQGTQQEAQIQPKTV